MLYIYIDTADNVLSPHAPSTGLEGFVFGGANEKT